MDIGSRIREQRVAQGLTQKLLSELSGVAEISIRQYENNKRHPKTEQLQKIAKILNVPVDYFLYIGDIELYSQLREFSLEFNISIQELISIFSFQGIELMKSIVMERELKIYDDFQYILDRAKRKEAAK